MRRSRLTSFAAGAFLAFLGATEAFGRCANGSKAEEMARDLSAMRGFAAAAETTGGTGKPVFVVSDPGDALPKPPNGSLREAMVEARLAGGGIILFQPPNGGPMTIELADQLKLPSNITIDGACTDVTITGREDISLFRIEGRQNIAIRRLSFRKNGVCDTGRDKFGQCKKQQDAIFVRAPADKLWIAQNSFATCGDGCVDIASLKPVRETMRATIAFNRFETHNKTMLIGDISCLHRDRALPACALSAGAAPTILVTSARNLFFRTTQRNPKVISRAFVHSIGNVFQTDTFTYANGRVAGNYAMIAASGGRVLSEGDVFAPVTTEKSSKGAWALTTPREVKSDKRFTEGPGAVRIVGAATTETVRHQENAVETVPIPDYPALPAPLFDAEDTASVRQYIACIAARAGAAATTNPTEPCIP